MVQSPLVMALQECVCCDWLTWTVLAPSLLSPSCARLLSSWWLGGVGVVVASGVGKASCPVTDKHSSWANWMTLSLASVDCAAGKWPHFCKVSLLSLALVYCEFLLCWCSQYRQCAWSTLTPNSVSSSGAFISFLPVIPVTACLWLWVCSFSHKP